MQLFPINTSISFLSLCCKYLLHNYATLVQKYLINTIMLHYTCINSMDIKMFIITWLFPHQKLQVTLSFIDAVQPVRELSHWGISPHCLYGK